MARTGTAEYYEWQRNNGCLAKYGERTDFETTYRLVRDVLPEGACILDLGCCTGSVAQYLFDNSVVWARYTGVDLSEQLIEAFKKRQIPRTEMHAGDVIQLEGIPDASFDVVLCLFLLQDLQSSEVEVLIRTIHNVLKPDGYLLLALTLATMDSKDLGNSYKAKVLAEQGIPGKETFLWSKPHLQKVLQDCGFSIHRQAEITAANGLLETYTLWKPRVTRHSS